MKNLFVNIFFVLLILSLILLIIENPFGEEQKTVVIHQNDIQNSQIMDGNYGLHTIKAKSIEDMYYLLGFETASNSGFQLYFHLYLALAKAHKIDTNFIISDYIQKRTNLISFSKNQYSKLKNKEIFIKYSDGINKFYKLNKTSQIEFGAMKIKVLNWEPWYSILIQNYLNLSTDIKQKLKITSDLFHYTLFSENYLSEIIEYYYKIPNYSNSINSINIKNDKFQGRLYSFKNYVDIPNIYYTYKINLNNNHFIFINTPGIVLPKLILSKENHLVNSSICEYDKITYVMNDDKIYFNDSLVNFKYKIDTLNNKFNYLFYSDNYFLNPYNLENRDSILIYKFFQKSKNLDSIINVNTDFLKYQNADISFENTFNLIQNSVRINYLENQSNYSDLTELELISNDNYSQFLYDLSQSIYDIFKNDSITIIDKETKLIINSFSNYKGFVSSDSTNTVLINFKNNFIRNLLYGKLRRKYVNLLIDFFPEYIDLLVLKNIEEECLYCDNNDLNNTQLKKIILKSLKQSTKNKLIFTRNLNIYYDNLFNKLNYKSKLKVNINYDLHSIRSNTIVNNKIFGNPLTIINDITNNQFLFQNSSGNSGNLGSANLVDLYRIWEIGGFIKFNYDLDNKTTILYEFKQY